MTTQELFGLGERSFTPQVTLQQLAEFGKMDFIMWNIDRAITCIPEDDDDSEEMGGYCKGMILKLNHPNYSDLLLITLSWDDTYRVRFINRDIEITDDVEGLYFDQLFEVINRRITQKKKFEFSLN